METAENYRSIEGAEMFFDGKPQQLFQQILTKYPTRIVSADYLADHNNQTLYLKISGNTAMYRVCLKYDQTTDGEYLIAVTESTYPAAVTDPHLLLTLMSWQGRPVYTPALRDDQRPVLGCSRLKASMSDLRDLYDMTIGLAEAMEQIDTALRNHSVFPYLWSNILPAETQTIPADKTRWRQSRNT